METLWFWLTAVMVVGYVVFDGFDLGAGVLHLFVGKDDRERESVLRSIGPVWDGNEVWLLAAGGTLVLAFPSVYAVSFSGFYLPLVLVLWLLVGRACAVEFRHHVDSPLWARFWDVAFAASSILLAVCFGAALGNVVRGVPLRADGTFFEPLWTHFGVHDETGILDWYTVLVGVAALAALALHGSLWIALKVEGGPGERARAAAGRLWPVVVLTTVLVTLASWWVQPHIGERMRGAPMGFALPAVAVGGLFGVLVFRRQGRDLAAFLASSAYLAGMLASAAFGSYPYLLPSNEFPVRGMTALDSAASARALSIGLAWWIPGMLIAIGYVVFVYRSVRGKVGVGPADVYVAMASSRQRPNDFSA